MPYKERLRNHGKLSQKKGNYQVTNWPEYNQSLKNRGSLTLWICEDIKDKWYAAKISSPRKGRPFYYSDYTITIMLTLRAIFKQKLRQIQGFVSSLFTLMNLKLDVPDYTRVSRRGAVPLLTRQLDKMKEPGHLVIDSTGIKVFGESEWLENKHGKQYKRKVWRKLHLGINKDGLIVSRVMTDHLTDDRSCLKSHLQQSDSTNVTEVLADSGYDGHETYSQLESINIKAIIPPARGSPSCVDEQISSRQKTVNYINKKGLYAWQTKNKYGRRSQVENMMYRYKEIIGRKLNSRLWNNQDAELHLGCFIMNTFSKLGMPITVKM